MFQINSLQPSSKFKRSDPMGPCKLRPLDSDRSHYQMLIKQKSPIIVDLDLQKFMEILRNNEDEFIE